MINVNNAIQGTIGQNNFNVTCSNFTGTIPVNLQNLYGTFILLKKYNVAAYEYIPLGSIPLDSVNIDNNGYNARFLTHPYVYVSEKAFGFIAFAIPSVNRVIAALTQAVYLSNRQWGDYYIHDNRLWELINNDLGDVFPNLNSGNWNLIDVTSAIDLRRLLITKVSRKYEYYYNNFMLIAPCRTETWTHTQACVNGKVTLSGVSNLGNTYGAITTNWSCENEGFTYEVSCVAGFIKISRIGLSTGSIENIFTQFPCDETQVFHDYYATVICDENCKPKFFIVNIYDNLSPTPNIPIAQYETNEECCGCEEIPNATLECDNDTGLLRVNLTATSCSNAYSLLTNIQCPSDSHCLNVLSLTKKSCNMFTIRHDNSPRTYYIKVRPYDQPFTEYEIGSFTIFPVNHPRINQSNPEYVLDMSTSEDGMYLVYLIWVDSILGEPIGRAVIMPVYRTCAMEACIEKLMKSILCMCDCSEGNDCNPELEAQQRYELNMLFSVISPVRELMMLLQATNGQVINMDRSLLQRYYDLGLMIKKMNLMIDRCGLCKEIEEDCGCN